MVYKKYIKKDGKLYGPYIYQSKRVNGKVVSEYCGPGKKENKKLIFYLLAFLIIGFLILIFFLVKGNLTGNVTLNLADQNAEGMSENSLQEISLSLKKGEFIPVSASVVFDTSQGSYEFPLGELVDEQAQEGKYFVEGENLSGQGGGYGLAGEKIIYPELEFTLLSKITLNSTSGGSTNELNPANELNSTNESGDINVSDDVSDAKKVEEEISQINVSQINVSENTSEKNVSENTQETQAQGIVSNILNNVNNFFLGLSLTGNTVESSSYIREIKAKVSKDNPFVYEPLENEIVELVPRSVHVNGVLIDDSFLSVHIEDGKFIVKSNYSEIQKGYGQEFLTNESKIINFSVPEQVSLLGKYNVKLVYPDVSSKETQELDVDVFIPEQASEKKDINGNISLNISQQETFLNTSYNASQVVLNFSKLELTQEEKQILINEFGNFSVNTFKSQLFNGRYIIGYKLGKYEIEYSYEPSLNQELLSTQIENDKIKWLKDIAYSLKDKTPAPIQITQFDTGFSIS